MATNLLKSLILTVCILCPITVSAQDEGPQPSKEMVIAQMNYCINSLTNIIHNKSMVVLNYETDMLLNNLTMEHVSNLYDVVEFRRELVGRLGDLSITEEERQVLKRVNEMNRSSLMWQSLSSALNPTMLLRQGSVGPQMAFIAVLTAARSVVEYKTVQNQQNVGELQAMWELRKKDLQDYIELRKSAIDLEYSLYSKYHLKERDRLTETTALSFQQTCSEPDAKKRLRLFEDNKEAYEHLLEYPYYVGMAYVDDGQYKKAKPYLQEYLQRYEKTPIFRRDEKSGCIAMAMLTCDDTLSETETIDLINKTLKNLPNVGAAAITCILKYIQLGKPQDAYRLLCSCIDNPDMDNKDILVVMVTRFIDDIKKYPSIYQSIESAISNTNLLDLNSLLSYTVVNNPASLFDGRNKFLSFDVVKRWSFYWWFAARHKSKKDIQLNIPSKYLFNIYNVYVYTESLDKKDIVIRKYSQTYKDGISMKKLRKVNCFKANPNLPYLFMNPLVDGEYYIVKQELKNEYSKILSGEFHGLSEYTLTDNDLKDIVKFCKKKTSKTPNTYAIISKKPNGKGKKRPIRLTIPAVLMTNLDTMKNSSRFFVDKTQNVRLNCDTLAFTPYQLKSQPKNLIRVVFDGMNKVVLSYVWNGSLPNDVKLFSVEMNGVVYFNDISQLHNDLDSQESETKASIKKEKTKSKDKPNKKEYQTKEKKSKKSVSKEADGASSVADDQPIKTSFWQKIKSWFTRNKSADKGKRESTKKENSSKDKKPKKSALKGTGGSTNMGDDQLAKTSSWEKVKSWFTRDKSADKEKSKSNDKSGKKKHPTKDKKTKNATLGEN